MANTVKIKVISTTAAHHVSLGSVENRETLVKIQSRL